MWTDPKLVLHYLQNEDRNFWIYVSQRINEILKTTEFSEWNFGSSESDIAEKTSGYQNFKQLSLEKSWFNGPTFLLNNYFNIEAENKSLLGHNINKHHEIKRSKIYSQLGILL